AGVVRPHRQLVDQDAGAAVGADDLEELDRHHPGHVEVFGQPQRGGLNRGPQLVVESVAGATATAQIPSRWTVSTTGHTAPWPNGDLATIADSSRTHGTRASAIMGTSAESCSPAIRSASAR